MHIYGIHENMVALVDKRELQVAVVMYHMLEKNDLIQTCNEIAIRS